MSKQQRKPAKATPIVANPLFPAVVALWFGAAFGLGSLAVRPSLLEDLVLKSHIDLVIPAAAPPLGITARILLALILAALGAVLGIALARRLTRPKIEERERKRGAKDLSEPSPRVRNRDAHPDAPVRRPISAREEFGDEEPFDAARPSGGLLANRRRSLAISEDEPAFVPHEAAPLPGLDPVEPLDLASLALPAEQAVDPGPTYAEPASPAPSLNWDRAAPLSAPPATNGAVPAAMVPLALDHAPEPAPVSSEAAHLDGRQVFGMAPPPAPETAPRQIFGIPADDDHVPQDFVQAAGFQTSVFDTPEPSPLFVRPADATAILAVPSEPATQETVPVQEAMPAAPIVSAAPAPVTAEPLPSPSSLGMTDLAARLADSMRRRRERVQAAAAPAAPEPAATQAPTEFQPAAQAATELPAMPAEFAASSVELAPPVAPAVDFASPAAAGEQPAALAPLAVPAAMRPLALDAFLEDDAALDDSNLLPPRHVAMPTPPQDTAQFAVPVAAAVEEPETTLETSLADVAGDNPYASLLEVAPVRQAHVRIDEPEPAPDAEIEPVVIFPGQAGLVVPIAPATQGSDETGFRRFDAPETAGQGQPVAGSTAASLIPSDEAAQALRAALSNLQRMSGAA